MGKLKNSDWLGEIKVEFSFQIKENKSCSWFGFFVCLGVFVVGFVCLFGGFCVVGVFCLVFFLYVVLVFCRFFPICPALASLLKPRTSKIFPKVKQQLFFKVIPYWQTGRHIGKDSGQDLTFSNVFYFCKNL